MILMFFFDLQAKGISENQAIIQVSSTLKVSRKKVHRVYNDWWHDQTLFATTGTGRGKVNTNNDARRTISADLESKLRQFINAEHTAGRQIFRRSVVEWMQENSDDSRPMSCRAVSALLYRMGYRRRRGRIKNLLWMRKGLL
ncbi:unnamed protein product, partial [Ascophyllum nodosum]